MSRKNAELDISSAVHNVPFSHMRLSAHIIAAIMIMIRLESGRRRVAF